MLYSDVIMKAVGAKPPGSGWGAVPGGKHGGMRRKKGNGYEYWYPNAASAEKAAAHHTELRKKAGAEMRKYSGAHETPHDWKKYDAAMADAEHHHDVASNASAVAGEYVRQGGRRGKHIVSSGGYSRVISKRKRAKTERAKKTPDHATESDRNQAMHARAKEGSRKRFEETFDSGMKLGSKKPKKK